MPEASPADGVMHFHLGLFTKSTIEYNAITLGCAVLDPKM